MNNFDLFTHCQWCGKQMQSSDLKYKYLYCSFRCSNHHHVYNTVQSLLNTTSTNNIQTNTNEQLYNLLKSLFSNCSSIYYEHRRGDIRYHFGLLHNIFNQLKKNILRQSILLQFRNNYCKLWYIEGIHRPKIWCIFTLFSVILYLVENLLKLEELNNN